MEITAVAVKLMPEYQGRVAFIDALTDDSTAREVLERYQVQYIPTSIFIGADGKLAEVYVGPLDEHALRMKIEGLLR